MEKAKVKLINMDSKQDADKIMAALETVWGISRAEVNLSQGEVLFMFDERMATVDDFKQIILDLGYNISND